MALLEKNGAEPIPSAQQVDLEVDTLELHFKLTYAQVSSFDQNTCINVNYHRLVSMQLFHIMLMYQNDHHSRFIFMQNIRLHPKTVSRTRTHHLCDNSYYKSSTL